MFTTNVHKINVHANTIVLPRLGFFRSVDNKKMVVKHSKNDQQVSER